MDATATPKLIAVVGSTFAGALLGACAAGLLLGREWSYNGSDLSIPVILTLYVLDAAVVVLVALLALYVRYRSVPASVPASPGSARQTAPTVMLMTQFFFPLGRS
jgi:hypothetical protein